MDTNQPYSPHDLLPAPEPRTVDPPDSYFYENVSKHLVKDVVRIMANGIPINMDRVRELEQTLDDVLAKVDEQVQANPLIKDFQALRFIEAKNQYIAEQQSKIKPPSHFIKPFNCTDLTHRSYFIHCLGIEHPLSAELLPTGVCKWTNNDVKRHCSDNPAVQLLLAKSVTDNNRFAREAMQLLAEHKAAIHNRRYYDNIANSTELQLPPFNPASSVQKQQLFAYLDIESESSSKETGLPKWNRDEIERVNKQTDDPNVKSLTQAFIDHSFGAIVRNNFIEAFYKYTVGDRLYGSLKLFGAKSFRLTSQNPFN